MRMAATASQSSSSSTSNLINDLKTEIRRHEIAIEEINSLSASRSVYVKNGNIFFRTSIQKAASTEQRKLDLAKSKMQKLDTK